MSGVSHTNTVLILSDLGLLSPSAHSWLCLKVPRQSWGRWAAPGAPPNPGAAPPGVIPLSFPARIDFQAKHFQQDKGEGTERGVLCSRGSCVAVPAPVGRAPACPSVPGVGPCALPGWDFGEIWAFLQDFCSWHCTLHLCGGLPGGGTAETDASQGKGSEQRSGMQSSGHRAGMEGLPCWLHPTAVLSSPCCCQPGKPDSS